jgi:threonyl-tRNA synthetase
MSQVDGDLWDLERPLEGSCKLELLDFEHPEGSFRFLCMPFNSCIFVLQAKRYSGTHLHTFLENLPSDTTGVTCV